MPRWDGLISILVILVLIVIIISKMKKQSFRETLTDLKDYFIRGEK